MNNDCLFCKIGSGEIPSTKLYEDENIFAFLDIRPVNVGHALVIPKNHYKNIYETPAEILGQIMAVVKKIATAQKEALGADGVNIGMNNDTDAGQLIFHTHIHIMPRYKNDGYELWHGKPISENEMRETQEKIKNAL